MPVLDSEPSISGHLCALCLSTNPTLLLLDSEPYLEDGLLPASVLETEKSRQSGGGFWAKSTPEPKVSKVSSGGIKLPRDEMILPTQAGMSSNIEVVVEHGNVQKEQGHDRRPSEELLESRS